MRSALHHASILAGFLTVAVVWTFPLVTHLSTHLPGAGIGDNALFLWNFWWMRTALQSGTDFFHTSYLFAPIGIDLTLHTHTAFPAFIGATLLRNVPLTAALNLSILASLSLNGFCTYLLAWRITANRGAAVLAGIIFACSPYIAAHLNGHFNLTTAWTIPLFALAASGLVHGSLRSAVWSGAILALTGYIDYYYLVYELAFAVGLLVVFATRWSLRFYSRPSYPRVVVASALSALFLDVVLLSAIGWTGGFVAQLGPIRISMLTAYNPLQLFWVCGACVLWLFLRPHVELHRRDGWSWRTVVPATLVMLGTFTVLSAPLVWKGIALIARGDYVAQEYYWRSSPAGIDVATIFMGNPFHGGWGPVVRRFYSLAGINVIESGAWLGVVPLVLSGYALRRKRNTAEVRLWGTIGVLFFVWALGPHLLVVGRNTGMILPETLLRYIPIASNARMPGRAMVMVSLAVAILAAIGIAATPSSSSRRTLMVAAAALLTFVDFFAGPFPITSAECPAIYQILRNRPEAGAVAELPLPLGDGRLGDFTSFDHRVFICQTIHQRPLVGGTTARLPPSLLAQYLADPLIAGWLRLSDVRGGVVPAGPLPDSQQARERLEADGIRFILLNRQAASPALREYVEHTLPLTVVAQDDDRVLFLRN